ncbi:MAG: TrmH family RNA methyltransferase [Thermoguttaceae bacterium]
MSLIPLETIDDPRIAPYLNVRERTLRGESVFIAEGELVAQRLLASPFPVESLLVVDRFLDRISASVPVDIPIYLVREEQIRAILGFEYYQGILALGRRLPFEKVQNSSLLQNKQTVRLVVLPNATKPDNLGLTFRSCAALGATAVLLGEQCCDPLSRRVLRVSMGGVLQVPILASDHLVQDLQLLKEQLGFELWGAVLDPTAKKLHSMNAKPEKLGILFGNEYSGLEPIWSQECQHKVIIPIRPDVDSLNLGVSVGIFLYELRRGEDRD